MFTDTGMLGWRKKLESPHVSYDSCTGFTIISTTDVSETHNENEFSVAWSAFHLNHVGMVVVSSEIMTCRLLK